MGLTKSNWKVDGKTKEQIEKERQEAVLKSQGHDHKSTTVILCEEHDGRLTIFDKCPFHCVLHECPNKTGIEQNYTSTVSPSTSDSLSPSVHSTDVKIETSWDDGFTFDFKIVELLKKYNLPGTFYIIVDAIGKEGFLTWEQIKDFDKQGFSIGSHTMTHPNDLKDLFEERLFYEIQNSKDIIEAALGHPISKFCYPRGRYDARVKEMVARAGYTEARVTGELGNTVVKDKLALPGTLQIFDRVKYLPMTVTEFAKATMDRVKVEGGYINIWGHSKEIEENKLWGALEEILAYAEKTIRECK